jgi:hypothetical protein
MSDGGHHGNLGLLALLRARCEVIRGVDFAGGPARSRRPGPRDARAGAHGRQLGHENAARAIEALT